MEKRNGKNNSTLLIFIKNPIEGKVKTRLASSVGNQEALRIYNLLLNHTRETTLKIDVNRQLYYDQFIDNNDEWRNSHFNKNLQSKGDLGVRMLNAFKEAFNYSNKVIIIGSDCAQISPQILMDAFQQLNHHQIVIGPTLDKGYYLLGMQEFYPEVLEGIPWSTSSVLPLTIEKCEVNNLSFTQLPTLSDIDYLEDWEKFGW